MINVYYQKGGIQMIKKIRPLVLFIMMMIVFCISAVKVHAAENEDDHLSLEMQVEQNPNENQ